MVEEEAPQINPASQASFKMLKPKILKTFLEKGLGPGISTIVIFSNVEGSIIARAGEDNNIHSQSAVLANICHEYIEFGMEAFNNNNLKTIFISIDNANYIAKPIHSLILCFVCKNGAKKRSYVHVMR